MRRVALMTRWLAYGLALLFIITAIGLTLFVQSRFEKQDQRPIQGAVNGGSQLRIEFLLFRFQLHQALLMPTEDDLDKAVVAYDVLLSRLKMLESKSAFRLPSSDPKLVGKFRELSTEIRSWEPLMVAFEKGDVAVGRRLMGSVDSSSVEFALLTTLISDYSYTWFVKNSESLDGYFIILAFVTLGSIATMGLLARFIFVSARGAETAFEDLRGAHQELSKAKTAAESSDRVKSQFLANVSHELRTPLNAIIGFSEMLLDKSMGIKSDTKREEYLRYVLNSGHHLLSLINDILDFSKIQQGRWDPVIQPLDLRAALGDIVRTMLAEASSRNVRLMERVDVNIPLFETDARAFRQILLNVLSNAVKFSPPEGRVEIEMRVAGAGVVIVEIDDEGPGIEDGFMKQIGAPFLQARSASLSGEAGTGLGLAITKELLTRLGGDFAIANRPEGGARVTLTLRSGLPVASSDLQSK